MIDRLNPQPIAELGEAGINTRFDNIELSVFWFHYQSTYIFGD